MRSEGHNTPLTAGTSRPHHPHPCSMDAWSTARRTTDEETAPRYDTARAGTNSLATKPSPASSSCCVCAAPVVPNAPVQASLHISPWIRSARCAVRSRSCGHPHRGGWVDFLYKAVGDGTRLLATRKGRREHQPPWPDRRAVRGHRKTPAADRRWRRDAADDLHRRVTAWWRSTTVRRTRFRGAFPFQPRPSQFLLNGIPDGVIAANAVVGRLGHRQSTGQPAGLSGMPPGICVTDLHAAGWTD